MKFFKYINGTISLDKDEIALYKLPYKILRRDRGSEGDADGRKKLQAFREFAYVYFVADHQAYPIINGMGEVEKHEYAIKEADLPSTFTPDSDLIDFIEQYKIEHWSQAKNQAYQLRRILRMNQSVADKIQNNIDKIMKGDLEQEALNQLINYQAKLLDIAVSMPKQIKALSETLKLIEDEEDTDKVIGRGGFTVSPSMDAGNKVEDDD